MLDSYRSKLQYPGFWEQIDLMCQNYETDLAATRAECKLYKELVHELQDVMASIKLQGKESKQVVRNYLIKLQAVNADVEGVTGG